MTELPPLTPRLMQIAALFPHGDRLADVGTDHAYLPAYLVAKGVCPLAYAGDINRGPLENAAATLARYAVADRVKTLLSPGLDAFPPSCADTVVIAGMGGDQIGEIVCAAEWLRSEAVTLLLQPMTMQERCRRSLHDAGFVCEKEVYAKEGKRLYVIMQYRFSPEPPKPLSVLDAYIGTAADNEHPLARDYLRARATKLRRMLAGMEQSERCGQEAADCRALLAQIEPLL